MIATLLAIVDPGDEVDRLRAVLRELRARRDPVGRDAAVRAAASAGRSRGGATGGSTRRARRRVLRIARAPSSSTRRTTRPARCSRATELETIARLCQQWGVIAITDEIYEHIVYRRRPRTCRCATIDGMADRTVTINSTSKTFSVTGWRVGWAVAPPDIAPGDPQGARFPDRRRRGAAAGGRRGRARRYRATTTAISRTSYRQRRDRLLAILEGAGFPCYDAARRVLRHDRRSTAFGFRR